METNQERLHLWERSWRASAILEQVMPAEDRAELAHLTTTRMFQSITDRLKSSRGGGASGMDMIGLMQDEAVSFSSRRRAIEGKAEAALKTYLGDMRVRAFAFENPRKVSHFPVDVTRYAYLGFSWISWSSATLKVQSLAFVELRFIGQVAIDRMLRNSRAAEVQALPAPDFTPEFQRKPGRPSVKPKLRRVISDMIASGEIDLQQSRKPQFHKVRCRLAALHPGAGITEEFPSEETIRRAMVEVENG